MPLYIWVSSGNVAPVLVEYVLLKLSPSQKCPRWLESALNQIITFAVRTALLALIGFMPTAGAGALGSLEYPVAERKKLAKK